MSGLHLRAIVSIEDSLHTNNDIIRAIIYGRRLARNVAPPHRTFNSQNCYYMEDTPS